MTKILKTVAAWSIAITLLGLATPGFAQGLPGYVRLVQTVPDVPPLDVFINGKKAISGLKYENFSDYVPLDTGNYDIKVVPAGSNADATPVINVPNFSISEGSISSILVVGSAKNNSLSALPLPDNNQLPMPGNAKVRFIHSSPDAPAVSINVSGLGDVFSNVSFKGVGSYTEIPAGSITLTFSWTNTHTTVLSKPLTLEAGKVYTIYAVGQLSNNTFNTLWSVDSSAPGMPATGYGAASMQQSGQANWQLAIILAVMASLAVSSFGLVALRNRKKSITQTL